MIPRKATPPKRAAVAVAALVSIGSALSACASPGPKDLPVVPSIPFTTSLTAASGEWVVIPMGPLTSVSETFWELFYRPSSASKWTEVTPPGVGDNGGLAIASDGRSAGWLTVGFEPSSLLGFSPLAATTNGGQSWSAGTLEGELAQVPDSLAAGPSGSALVLVRQAGDEIYSSKGALGGWTKVIARSALGESAAGKQCRVGALTSVAIEAGTDLIGGTCGRPGVIGILSRSQAGSWQLSGPSLPHGYATGTTEVLRLDTVRAGSDSGVSTLVAVKHGNGVTLLGFSRTSPSSPWSVSAGLNLPLGDAIDSTGYSRDGGYLVLARTPGGITSLSYSSPTGSWTTTSDLPAGTSAAVFTAAGAVAAITHSQFQFKSWARSGSGTWSLQQTINVPVPVGSSG